MVMGLTNDKDKLLRIHEVFNHNAAESNQRIWDTVKFFTTLISSLIPVTLASSIAAIQYGQVGSLVPIKVLLILIPTACLGASIIGWRNLRRECIRMYEYMAVAINLRKLLGLLDIIVEEDERVFSKEEGILPSRYLKGGEYNHIDDFVNDCMGSRNGLHFTFQVLFVAYVLMSVVMVLCELALAFILPIL